MKISEIRPKQGSLNLVFDVVDKGEVREFNKFGNAGRVCNATVQDDSGKVKLSLWNEDCDKVNVGDKVKLTNGYAGEYQGEIQLTAGRMGKLEIVGKATAAPEPKPAPSAKKGEEADSDEDAGDDFSDDEFEEPDEEFVD